MLFFSSQSVDESGIISDPTPEENHLRKLMIKNAGKSVFLCDSEKFGRRSRYSLAFVGDVDICVFDKSWQALEGKCKIL